MTKEGETGVTVRMPTPLYERLKALADQEERTVAAKFRMLAKEHLDALDGVECNCSANRNSDSELR